MTAVSCEHMYKLCGVGYEGEVAVTLYPDTSTSVAIRDLTQFLEKVLNGQVFHGRILEQSSE